MALIDKKELAKRLARAIASDVSLYNEQKIVEGIVNDDLFTRLKDEIEEGRELYRSRVSAELDQGNLYDLAIVDVLLKAKAHVKSKIW